MWNPVMGHDAVLERFARAWRRRRLASTFLFVGPAGVGKRTAAQQLAGSLLCQGRAEGELVACRRCASCGLFAAGNHPDLLSVAKPDDRAEIPLRLILGPPERRMQKGLCHDLWQKPLPGSRRIAILDDADFLNEESANALLKTLEEPPPGALVFLIATSSERQLPTIRSRAQIFRFGPLSEELVARLLVERQLVDDPAQAARLAKQSCGSVASAMAAQDEAFWAFRQQWISRFTEPRFDAVAAAKDSLGFIDAAGKDPGVRRQRARQLIDATTDLFHAIACAACDARVPGDDVIRQAAVGVRWLRQPRELTAVECAERSLSAREQLDRFANQATLVECWLDDLAAAAERT